MMTYPEELLNKAKKIKLVITDVDGVLTDGKVHLDQKDNELKAFNIKDGLGIKWLLNAAIPVAIITGRASNVVTRRMQELGVTEVYQKQPDKRACFQMLLQKYQINCEEVAYLGDDLPDLALINQCGLGVTVADGHWSLKESSHWITPNKGGEGAFRDLAELILSAQQQLESILQGYQS